MISSPRQKACCQCFSAKTKCDLKSPACSRCVSRREACEYVSSVYRRQNNKSRLPRSSNPTSRGASNTQATIHARLDVAPGYINTPSTEPSDSITGTPDENACHDPVNQKLSQPRTLPSAEDAPHTSFRTPASDVPTSDTALVHDRWLYPYVGHPPARYSVMKQSMSYLCRVFRTYPKMMARREQVPPFIHPTQLSNGNVPLPLANCFALSRMWEGSRPEDGDGSLIRSTIQKEMEKLFSEVRQKILAFSFPLKETKIV